MEKNVDKAGASVAAIETMFTGEAAGSDSGTVMTIVGIAESILKVILNYFSSKEKE